MYIFITVGLFAYLTCIAIRMNIDDIKILL